MKDVIDVAAYVLQQVGDVSTMKLQKLVYYSQAYSLVQYDAPLFDNRIEAWANGPVVRDLFFAHKGQYVVNESSMNFSRKPIELDRIEKSCVDRVVSCLGEFSGAQLSELTHSEKPWLDAREGLEPGASSENVITREAIQSYYSSPECDNCVFRAA